MLDKVYQPQKYEGKIYEKWEKGGHFTPKIVKGRKPFVISMPPPNVTGVLHMGHAMPMTIEDIMIRYHRMKGEPTLWLPGTDHAAIATQNRVEQEIAREGETREKLGRERFLQRVKLFVEESKHTIRSQIKKLGCSCDWSRERYTLDAGLTRAVQEAFVRMYNDGLIYRGYRIVNWCPRCQSTLADDEVEYEERKAKLYYIKYGPLTLATVRPETKFGDTAVAVHPDDKRYQKYIGKEIEIRTVLGKAKIKVIADKVVDPKFGTGAVKVTPAHDPTDFEIGQRHRLEIRKVINEDGRLNKWAGKYAGLKTEEARKRVVADMKKLGLLAKEEPYKHNLSICYRCQTPIEPLPSEQWFINVDSRFTIHDSRFVKLLGKKKVSLKELATIVVKKNLIKIVPERFTKVYFQWMKNLRDWCISRQIWWGHQIPVFYKGKKQGISNFQSPISKNLQKSVKITYFPHGTTFDNEKGLATGQADTPLSELGIKQVKELKDKIKGRKFDLVFSSDLKRAVQTAEIIFGKKIIKDKRLREVDHGKWTQRKNSVVYKDQISRINKSLPGGETYKEVESRLRDFLAELMDKYPGKKVAIISHKIPQYALEVLVKNKSWEQEINEDWRKTKSWQPGWDYELSELVYVGTEAPASEGWVRDPDTLDTWFSSALWTFSTLGWPEETEDLKYFHPTTVMETGYDILFFWVARMIIMTTYLLGDVPFKTVYLNGLVRDKLGRKMSKSLDNGIDPIEMIKKFGADATRLSLIVGTAPGSDIRLYEEKIAGFRNFANKLWNISRFILSNDKIKQIPNPKSQIPNKPQAPNPQSHITGYDKLTLVDQWILSQCNQLIQEVTEDLDNFQFGAAGEKIFAFTWSEFADWYLEISKVETYKTDDQVMLYVLDTILRLLHPFMPFVTEAIWSEMGQNEPLIVAQWPKIRYETRDTRYEMRINELRAIIRAIRNLRATYRIPTAEKLTIKSPLSQRKLIGSEIKWCQKLAGVKTWEFVRVAKKVKNYLTLSANKFKIHVLIKGVIDTRQEIERREKEVKALENQIVQIGKKLGNKNFLAKAPAEIVGKEKDRVKEFKGRLNSLQGEIKILQ